MKNNQPLDFSQLSEIFSSGDGKARQNAAKKIMSGLNEQEGRELNEIINNKEKIETILNSPAVKQIISKLQKGKNGKP